MPDYLNAEFIRGYTKAIQDIQCIFENVHEELAWRRIPFNYKSAMELLDIILKNRMPLREQDNCNKGLELNQTTAFIRWNVNKKCLEYYDPKRGRQNEQKNS